MSNFFLELFSEEIPSSLQKKLREDLLESFNKLFGEKFISFKKSSSFSTPNRLIILFEGLHKQIVLKSEEIKGPNINASEIALEGFIRSNNISKKELFKKKIDKGEFHFFKIKSKKLNTHDLLEEFVPLLLQKIQWKKSMKWGEFDLNWGRPLKSISLNADSAVMTCIVNDYGYEQVFSRQVDGLGMEGDVLVGISTSGDSDNVNNAFRMAKEKKMHTVGLLGKGGGEAFKLVSNSIVIPSRSTARIQEMHIIIGHILCELIEDGLAIN